MCSNYYSDYYRRTEFTVSGILFLFNSQNSVSKRERKGEACCQSIRSNINESLLDRIFSVLLSERFQS